MTARHTTKEAAVAPRIGYLLPTREQVMQGHPEAAPLLDLAARAENLGYDSVWVGDSLLARPRKCPVSPADGDHDSIQTLSSRRD